MEYSSPEYTHTFLIHEYECEIKRMIMIIQYLKKDCEIDTGVQSTVVKKSRFIKQLVVITQQILFIIRYLTDN
jgi:hypothetical protein